MTMPATTSLSGALKLAEATLESAIRQAETGAEPGKLLQESEQCNLLVRRALDLQTIVRRQVSNRARQEALRRGHVCISHLLPYAHAVDS
jgi:hypothetical protein